MPVDVLGTRTPVHYYGEAYAVTASDALVPITGVVRGTAAVVTTQLTVTNGRVLRVQRIMVTGVQGGTTAAASTVRLRANLAPGAATLTSAIWWTGRIGSPSVATQVANHSLPIVEDVLPEGMEFPSGTGLQFSAVATGTTGHVLTFSLYGFEYIP
jgi:hypothetical protein